MTVKPLSPCQKCHFIKAQTNSNIVKAVQQESKIRSKDDFNKVGEENNANDTLRVTYR